MKQIRDIRDVPWFDSKNYQQLGALSHEEWLLELETRAHYYNTPFTGPRQGTYFNLMRPNGPEAIEAEQIYAENYKDILIRVNDEFVFTQPVTRSAHFARLKFSYDMGNMAIRPIPNGEPAAYESTAIPCYIDVSAPDVCLHHLLDLTLERARKDLEFQFPTAVGPTNFNGKVSHIDDVHLRSWGTSGLLQYLDLYQWALLSEVKITSAAYATAIHTGRTTVANPGQSIAQTTKHLANLVQQDMIKLKKQLGGRWSIKDQ